MQVLNPKSEFLNPKYLYSVPLCLCGRCFLSMVSAAVAAAAVAAATVSAAAGVGAIT